jgi:hypothetical protein
VTVGHVLTGISLISLALWGVLVGVAILTLTAFGIIE